jgi:DNA-directed RNA polymerase subunit RPC12/RpoP
MFMSSRKKLKGRVIDLPFNETLVIIPHLKFRDLREIFDGYKLILSPSESDIEHREYKIKKGDIQVGKLIIPNPKFFENPSIGIYVDKKHEEEVFQSIGLETHEYRCPSCGSDKRPVAIRAPASYGRRPYSTELSYNCPVCGNEFWPERIKKIR